jgi:integrase
MHRLQLFMLEIPRFSGVFCSSPTEFLAILLQNLLQFDGDLCVSRRGIMPASMKMTWDGKDRRWAKRYTPPNGETKRHSISCRQLAKWSGKNFPWTQEGSYQIANAWWRAKQAELDGYTPPHPYADWLQELALRRSWALQHDQPALAAELADEIARIERGGLPSFRTPAPPVVDDPRPLDFFTTDEEPPRDYYEREAWEREIDEAISPLSPVWSDRIKRDSTETTPIDKTIKSVLSRYLAERVTSKVDDGELSLSEYNLTRMASEFFAAFIGADTSIDRINAEMIDRYWRHIRDNGGSVSLKMKRLRFVRRFVRWLATLELIPRIPLNLDDRTHTFKQSHKAIVTVSKEDVHKLFDAATGQLKLHLLLMLNTGMTQGDVSALRQDEVDWTQGRIIRKRTKTKDHPNVPIVDYKLWPLTFELLRQYREPEGDIVLLTRSKKPWTSQRLLANGKVSKTDSINTNYAKLATSLGIKTTLKHFRKTSASLLKTHRDYQTFDVEFLDHAPNTMAAIHYSETPKVLFDEAVLWLGEQLGFISPPT